MMDDSYGRGMHNINHNKSAQAQKEDQSNGPSENKNRKPDSS